MEWSQYPNRVIEFNDEDTVTIHGVGKPKTLRLPREVVSWLAESRVARRALEELVTNHRFKSRLSNPGSLRSLLLLLYSRAKATAPYKVARMYGVAPEQLYRLERGLKRDGLYEAVMELLSLEE